MGAPWEKDGSRTSGARLFGARADFAEHYLNDDDIVPSTNFALPLCYVYDVTRSRERSSFPPPSSGAARSRARRALHSYPAHPPPPPRDLPRGRPPALAGNLIADLGARLLGYHSWPIGYLARHHETELDADGAPRVPSHEELPRGRVFRVA